MKKLVLIFAIFLACMQVGSAQQDTHYTGYMFNSLVINPAYTGSRSVSSAMAYYRHQWADISTAPRDISISYHQPFATNSGIGGFIENDKIGVHNRLRAFITYAYRLRIGSNVRLSLGLQGGILRYGSKFSDVANLQDANDVIFQQDQAKYLPNFGVGIFCYTNQGYIGLSVPHLLNNRIYDYNSPGTVDRLSQEERHFFLTGGTVLSLNSDFKIRPTAIVKVVPLGQTPVSVDLSLATIFGDKFLFGLAHRFKDSFSAFTEYQINQKLRIGYAYDYPLKQISHIVGSHELFIGYEFGFEDERIVTPRYF